MHKEITGTDIRRIAEGCWENHFRSRFHPRVKTPWLIALITFVSGIAIILADCADRANEIVVSTSPSAIAFVAVALVFIAAGFFVKGMLIGSQLKDDFMDMVIDRWEGGDKSLPDSTTVTEFLKSAS